MTKRAKKRPAHRPPFDWTPEIEEKILTEIMCGSSLARICGTERDPDLPSESTFYARLAKDPEFSERYARAREAQGHREADEIREIADLATPEQAQVAKLRIDARKWRASKLAPKVYGDRQTVEHSGKDGGPIETKDLSSKEIARRIAFMLASGVKEEQ